ncbi:LLM class flavin-dependent oxidoreductase [Actinomadura geliboluensis]|uniref:LLM class flavin-dependent oxidoreductase n=1 Tax=Actinomadura geliboluensis TaxID=882440 RepID=UPI00371C7125
MSSDRSAMPAASPGTVRIGLHSGQQYAAFGEIEAVWRTAEELGYDWVSLFDHLRPAIHGPAGPCLEAVSTLAALAARIPRVRCGLLVSHVGWRQPAVLAAAAATIDHISGGRLELGLGAGGPDLAFGQYGLPRPSLRIRAQQLAEACEVIRLLFTGGPVSFTGRHFQLRDAHLAPAPVQAVLPLVIGGRGPDTTLPVAASHAQVWNCATMPIGQYAATAERFTEQCVLAGRDPASVRRSLTFRAAITPDRARATAARARVRSNGHEADLSEYVCWGSPHECLDALAPYLAHGVTDFLLGARPPVDWRTVERFALEVAPLLRKEAGSR